MMEDYKPNSHKSKVETTPAVKEKKVEKVVRGAVKTKRRGEMSKIRDVFISEDATNVKSYILLDVLVPAIKDAIEDIITNGIRIILRGEAGACKRGGNRASTVSYSSYYDSKKNDRFESSGNRVRSAYSLDDIILETRGEAEEVLSRMDEIIDNYDGIVSVADLYDLVGITGSYTDHKYGWTNLRNAKVVRVREGYILDLPKALPIK